METLELSRDTIEREVVPAWNEIVNTLHIRHIENERDYELMLETLDALLAEVLNDETHPLRLLFEMVAREIEEYEKAAYGELPKGSPKDALRFLMDSHDLKQSDLIEELGTQSIASEILSGKRKINAQQARALANRFHVSTDVFIED